MAALGHRSPVVMGSLSAVHWLLVIAVILLVFGPSKLASVGKGLGEGIRNFKKGISDKKAPASDEEDDEDEDEASPKQLSSRRDTTPRHEKARQRKTT